MTPVPPGHSAGASPAAGPALEQASGEALLQLLSGFIVELREAGLPVSLTENLDALEAVKHIPLEDRSAFKYALGATLVKSAAHWRAFETVFANARSATNLDLPWRSAARRAR